jgi:hypothetical protein
MQRGAGNEKGSTHTAKACFARGAVNTAGAGAEPAIFINIFFGFFY